MPKLAVAILGSSDFFANKNLLNLIWHISCYHFDQSTHFGQLVDMFKQIQLGAVDTAAKWRCVDHRVVVPNTSSLNTNLIW